jgi:PKD repeat protein
VDDGNKTRCSTASSSVNVSVNASPTVTLSNVDIACLGNAVKFNADAKDPDGDSLAYDWDFGDGTVVEGGSSQSHTYAEGGTYNVLVTVSDRQGTPCSSASAGSKVKVNSRPLADAGPNLVCCVDKVSVFDGSGSSDPDGDKLSYFWDFGDGSTAEGAKVSHSYTKSGVYTVMLTVNDNAGTPCSAAASSFKATVNESPVSIIKIK